MPDNRGTGQVKAHGYSLSPISPPTLAPIYTFFPFPVSKLMPEPEAEPSGLALGLFTKNLDISLGSLPISPVSPHEAAP